MRAGKFITMVIIIFSIFTGLLNAGCSLNTSSKSSNELAPADVLRPQPLVENVVATTSGTEKAYYVTLEIKVKNTGAEGTILVQAEVTQNGVTATNEMPVFLKQNQSHQIKMTFPLVWQGGAFTSNVKTFVP